MHPPLTTPTPQPKSVSLQHLLQSAIWAHNWTSFDPTKRGTRFINDYTEQLNADLVTLVGYGATDEQQERYRQGYEQRLRAWISAKSNCASSVITGGSGFNVQRAERNNKREHAHFDEFNKWREKVLTAWRREDARRKKAAVTEEAGGEAALMRRAIESAKADHERRKAANKTIKQANKDGKDISEWLISEFDAEPHMIDWYMKFGVTSCNATANIRRMEDRLKELEAKETRQAAGGAEEKMSGAGWRVVENNEADRLQIIFEDKPNDELRVLLKRHGFKWAPSAGAWQRQLTGNAVYSLKQWVLPALPKAEPPHESTEAV